MENQLKDRDYTLIVDKSGSMATEDTPAGSRWKAAKEATVALAAKINELDPDGITFYAFSSKWKRHDNVTPSIVDQTFQEHEPNGGTNLAGVLKDGLDNYFFRKQRAQTKAHGEMFLIVTDGTPDNEQEVRDVIIAATKKMDHAEELELCFVQVGRDAHASLYLKNLDDGLQEKGAKYDIVDTITIEEMGNRSLIEVLTAAVTTHSQN